ncbi:MAG: formylglycine-generating enzyme family protein [Bacteroidota bacterium]
MKYLLLITSLLGLLGLATCTSEGENRQQHAEESLSQEGLDLSRTNAVKNTPSRANGDSTVAIESIPAQDADQDLITELPTEMEAPDGMIFVPGGEMVMGSAQGLPREQPEHAVQIQGFFMDEGPVTVAEYQAFVEETGYKTEAEKFGDAVVFDLDRGEWYLKEGAYWAFPLGKEAPAAKADHPVTQVSWNDAKAYAAWAGKRLPMEAEWEHAARNGRNSRMRYGWGDDIRVSKAAGRYQANIWQGTFPAQNTGEDGYLYTSPAGLFNENELGLKDLSGNVWEWCEDWYQSYDPAQPDLAPTQTAEPEKVMRGGSFMCDPSYCWGYRVSGRSGSSAETGLFHVGFRCVKEIK